jgi:hypothetical protein
VQCEDIQELIYLQAAGVADLAASTAIQNHLADGCPGCQAVMAEAQVTAAHIPLELPPLVPSETLKDELMRRISASGDRVAVKSPPSFARPAPTKMLMWPLVISSSIAAAFLLIAIMGLQANQRLLHERVQDLTAMRSLKASFRRDAARVHALSVQLHEAMALDRNKIAVLQAELTAAQNVEKMIGSPALEMASLRGTAPMRSAWGRVMWNDKMKMWKLCAFNLPHLPKTNTYEVWLITASGKKMPAGLFNTSARTLSAMVTPKVPASPHTMAEIAVTVEPAGGSPQPTGAVLLAGHIG